MTLNEISEAIKTLSIEDLNALSRLIPGEIKHKKQEEQRMLLLELEQIAAAKGFRLKDLVSAKKESTTTRSAVQIKYRHPADESLTWTGRGRQPIWVRDFIVSGGTLDQLAV